jgi:hypothetical protein
LKNATVTAQKAQKAQKASETAQTAQKASETAQKASEKLFSCTAIVKDENNKLVSEKTFTFTNIHDTVKKPQDVFQYLCFYVMNNKQDRLFRELNKDNRLLLLTATATEKK